MNLDKKFLSLLCSPDDGSPLTLNKKNQLVSTKEGHVYDIEDGIPQLYPKDMNMDHMHEEEHLAEMMEREPTNKRDAFSLREWQASKQEYWNIVKQELTGKKNKTIVYLGCGFDAHAHEFMKDDHLFINFDMIVPMLKKQQDISHNDTNVAGDMNQLPFAPNSVDYVISIDVIHHEYYALERIVKKMTHILKPGGVLFLEDPNAWGLFQWPKSLLLPKFLYIPLRRIFHTIKKSAHKPADYEFPTSVWHIRRILKRIGMSDIIAYPQYAYPETTRFLVHIYRILSRIPCVAKYHNFHYMLRATKKEAYKD